MRLSTQNLLNQLSSFRPPFLIARTMNEPSLNFVTCPDAADGHRMAYWQWGQPDSPHVVLCVHGLTRQGRDFDVLAQALCAQAGLFSSAGIRVICPDVAGRGESEWLKDPAGYQVPAYAADMLSLLAHLHAQSPIVTLDWVGTSMGGLIGLVACGQPGVPLPVPIRKLVLNDVGPALQWRAIQRIGAYLGQSGHFNTVQEAADLLNIKISTARSQLKQIFAKTETHRQSTLMRLICNLPASFDRPYAFFGSVSSVSVQGRLPEPSKT